MLDKILRDRGNAVFRDIAWRSDDDHALLGTDWHRDHVLRDDLAKPDASVIAFGNDVTQSVVDDDLDLDVRVHPKKRDEPRPKRRFGGMVGGGNPRCDAAVNARQLALVRRCASSYLADAGRSSPQARAPSPNVGAEPARHSCAAFTFEPGARLAGHIHPLRQTLVVTAGCGWTQCEGEAIVETSAGDVIWCPPGHKHWHGAAPTTAMTHIAIQGARDGKNVVWMEKVTDADYFAGPVPC